MADRPAAREALASAARERILILDGAMGTQIQGLGLGEDDFTGHGACAVHGHPQQGNNDLLILTQPEAIEEIHYRYAIAGADIVETNTFSSTRIAQADYGMGEQGARAQRPGRAAGAPRLRPCRGGGRAAALRRRRARADQPHRLDLARRQQPRLPGRDLRRPAGRLCRAGRRARRRRRRPDPDRDDLRHAERQGGDLRLRGGLRRQARAAADHDLGDDHRPLGAHAFGPDADGVLALGPPRAAVHRRAQLRARRGGDAGACRRALRRRRHAHLRLSERGAAERVRRLRREPGVHGGAARGVRARGPAQRRRRLLRHDARAHPRHRGDGGEASAAAGAGARAADAAFGARAVHADQGDPLRQRRRADQRHRLGALPQARSPPATTPPRSRSRATRSRTARRSSTSTWTRD